MNENVWYSALYVENGQFCWSKFFRSPSEAEYAPTPKILGVVKIQFDKGVLTHIELVDNIKRKCNIHHDEPMTLVEKQQAAYDKMQHQINVMTKLHKVVVEQRNHIIAQQNEIKNLQTQFESTISTWKEVTI